jgi:hypothetical protein
VWKILNLKAKVKEQKPVQLHPLQTYVVDLSLTERKGRKREKKGETAEPLRTRSKRRENFSAIPRRSPRLCGFSLLLPLSLCLNFITSFFNRHNML